MTEQSFEVCGEVLKADESLGLVFGWGIVCTKDDKPFVDSQDDWIPPDAMLKASVDFMKSARTMDLQHSGIAGGMAPNSHGSVVFAWPMTKEIASAYGITTDTEGLMIAVAPDDPATLAKFKSGELSGFSIGGARIVDEEMNDA